MATQVATPANVFSRNNVKVRGAGRERMVFAHGFGCDQAMWRFVAPEFERDFRTVLFDHTGCGNSAVDTFDPVRYSTLEGWADDVIAVCDAAGVSGGTFTGHSVSSIIGLLAAAKRPDLFRRLILVAPSPCYINDPESGYTGGFTREDIEDLLSVLESNYLGWSRSMAPVIMGNPARPELTDELEGSFCRTDPQVARVFARATFLSDHRGLLRTIAAPCLILQCSDDAIAPSSVGEFMKSSLRNSTLVNMKATGHCPNLSAPEETAAAIREFLESQGE